MPCVLVRVPGSDDFQAPTGADVTVGTRDRVGTVLILQADYDGTPLVTGGQPVRTVTFAVLPGLRVLNLVLMFSASTTGRGELHEEAPPDSCFLRVAFGHEALQTLRIIGA